ncbi:hypothetical protein FN846DRAFT_670514 [Sphaerosporella brunnea]|uniref:PiggyBac transposable element-derived protein domain-containing protein n=1 Tax=Sphaerosporella brunnea TaxID=1250544 RepID=A0A5J5FBB7_9PEZI|nr:hypothetical protein FN846DRAFT_670514 [Sphaerosporella brunnea]
MGGVDIADQRRSYCSIKLRTVRNWLAIFFWLLDTAIINAYIICQETFKGSKIQFLEDHRRFRIRLAWNLMMERASQINARWMEEVSTQRNLAHHGRYCPGAKPSGNTTQSRVKRYVSKKFELSPLRKSPGHHQITRLSARTSNSSVFCRFCVKQKHLLEVQRVLAKMPKPGKKGQTAYGCSTCNVFLYKDFCARAYREEL